MVVMFAYVAQFTQRMLNGNYEPSAVIPSNLLLAMGFSATTLAAAKAITVAYVANGRVSKAADNLGGIFTDDTGQSDLAKTQLVGWTFIGVVIYLFGLFRADPAKGLPDIDASLMVLMGLGHGAYVGKKLVTTDTPQLLGITPLARPGRAVEIVGAGFGTQVGTILIDDHALIGVPVQWADTALTFTLPAAHPSGSAWRDGQNVTVTVNAGGQTAANPQALVVGLRPRPTALLPSRAEYGARVRLMGQLLAGMNSSVTVDGVTASVVNGDDASLEFTVPQLTAAKIADVLVTVDGYDSPTKLQLQVVTPVSAPRSPPS
jgi:hypothetical protein